MTHTSKPQNKQLVIIKAKGTDKEKRSETGITLYPVFNRKGEVKYVCIPQS